MAVSQNDTPKYQAEWMEVQGFSTYGYSQRVLQRLGWDDDSAGKNRRKVHNVYAGIIRDWTVLAAIRAELLPAGKGEGSLVERESVMAK